MHAATSARQFIVFRQSNAQHVTDKTLSDTDREEHVLVSLRGFGFF